MNFMDKPVTTTRKKAAKKNVFFSDSDEDEDSGAKPVAPKATAPVVATAPPTITQQVTPPVQQT